MVRITFILAVGSTVLFEGPVQKAMAGDRTMAVSRGEIMPLKAYPVFTKESWGCLEGQAIVAEKRNASHLNYYLLTVRAIAQASASIC
jgi:hypothetical protein